MACITVFRPPWVVSGLCVCVCMCVCVCVSVSVSVCVCLCLCMNMPRLCLHHIVFPRDAVFDQMHPRSDWFLFCFFFAATTALVWWCWYICVFNWTVSLKRNIENRFIIHRSCRSPRNYFFGLVVNRNLKMWLFPAIRSSVAHVMCSILSEANVLPYRDDGKTWNINIKHKSSKIV